MLEGEVEPVVLLEGQTLHGEEGALDLGSVVQCNPNLVLIDSS